jgi:thiol-disulfide isomerase/thioredoxin
MACVGLLAACVALAGCGTFFKKAPNPNANPAPVAPGAIAPPVPVRPNGAPPPDPVGSASPYSGILAGQVLDSYSRRPPPTYIQVIASKDKDGKETTGSPIEVATDNNGYFTIQGLKPGQHYQLIARAKDGDRKLGGMTWARPPDPRVLIRISEDLTSPDANRPAKPPENAGAAVPRWSDGSAGTLHRAVELGQPVPRPAPAGSPAPPAPLYTPNPENIADDRLTRGATPPLVTVPGPPRESPPAPAPAPPAPESSVPPPVTTSPRPSAPIPFCALTGRKLDNFGLYDVNGQSWEFAKHRQGRLVLLDFWSTNCIPCIQAIPHLKDWNQRYGPYGLEIVSIGYDNGTPDDQVRKIRGIRGRYNVDYRMLLGTNPASKCPVKSQFQVHYYPVVLLLDESGQILWRSGNDGLGPEQLRELDYTIRQRLGLR